MREGIYSSVAANETSIFDELDQKTIAPQRFGVAIGACVALVVLSYAEVTAGQNTENMLDVADIVLGTYVLLFLRRYLGNFRAQRAIRWTNWGIGLNIALGVLYTINMVVGYVSAPARAGLQVAFSNAYIPVMSVVAIADLVVMIGQGVALQRISNDFIGLLRAMGITLTYVLPVCYLVTAVTEVSRFTSRTFTSQQLLYIHFFDATVNKLPDMLMIVIFYRAMKYRNG